MDENENPEPDESDSGPPPLTDLDDYELLDLGVNLLRGNRRYDTANRFENVGDLTELEDDDLEPLLGSEVGDEIVRRRAELVAKATEEEDRLKKEALESETPEQRSARLAQEAEEAQKGQQELEDQVHQEVLGIREKFAAMRAGRFQMSRRGTFPHLEKSEHEQAWDEIQEVLGPAEKLAGLKGVEFLDSWDAADGRTRELAKQFFGVTPPVDLDVDGDGYREAVRAHAQSTGELSKWAQGQLKAHKERTYR